MLLCWKKYTHTHLFFKSTNEVLKSCMLNPLGTEACLIVFGCASTAYSKKTYWVYMWTTTPLKLCERRATKESDWSVGASLSMRRTPSLEFWECNENIDYAVGTNIFVGIRVLSVLALCADFDTHLESTLKSFSVGYGHSRSDTPDPDHEISAKTWISLTASDKQTDLNL